MPTEELEETGASDSETPEESQPLNLEIKVESPSACQRHVTVTVGREDIDRYYDEAFSEMMGTASVPGFRAGRAPRKLVEARFRKEVSEQVKGSLLIDSMSQVNEDEKLAAISEPDIDFEAVEVPDEGPMTFEFDLEVRPDFDMPQWKGLQIERPTQDFADEDIDRQLGMVLARYGRQVPTSDAASEGDFVAVDIDVRHDGDQVFQRAEETIRVRPTVSFRDTKIEGFDQLMTGANAGDERETQVTLSNDAPNEQLAGKQLTVKFGVLDVKKFELPELSDDFLKELGDFDSEGDLRDAVKDSLERQLEYEQRKRVRQQITQLLTEAANWELPPDLLRRQSRRELERSILELRRSGFPEDAIQAHANELRQNSMQQTAGALREHFILERIAEDEQIDASQDEFDEEIALIASQGGESPRRVRAQIEKQDLMDSLRNQIVERKVIDAVIEQAKFKDVPFDPPKEEIEAIDLAIGGGDKPEIPEAEHGDAGQLAERKDHS